MKTYLLQNQSKGLGCGLDVTGCSTRIDVIEDAISVDKQLCLLEKYRYYLKHGDKTSTDFFRKNYTEYIEDVKAALKPEDNHLLGAEMCEIVSKKIDTIEKMLISLLKFQNCITKGKLFPHHKRHLKFLKI